jgi:hypothetical protein
MHNDLRGNSIRKSEVIGRGHAIDKHTHLIPTRDRINDVPWIGWIAFFASDLLCEGLS